jgi:DNA-binding CsgD family transcriptional regulator
MPWAEYGKPVTVREQQVARLFVLDHPKKEIAAMLNVSGHCIHAHILHVYIKLGVNSQMQLVAWALRTGVITVDDIKAIKPNGRYHGV